MSTTFHILGDVARITLAMIIIMIAGYILIVGNVISKQIIAFKSRAATGFVQWCCIVLLSWGAGLTVLAALWTITGAFLRHLIVPLFLVEAGFGAVGSITRKLLVMGDKGIRDKFDLHQATV